jgi:hypothetical protein
VVNALAGMVIAPSLSTRSACPSGRSTGSDPSASLSTIMRRECATGVPVSIGRKV